MIPIGIIRLSLMRQSSIADSWNNHVHTPNFENPPGLLYKGKKWAFQLGWLASRGRQIYAVYIEIAE